MGDVNTNYKVNVGVDDAKWQEFVKSVAALQSSFGGATKAAVESAQKIAASFQESSTKQVASKKKIVDADDAAIAAMNRNVEKQVKENQKAAAAIESAIKKESAAKAKATAAAEKAAEKQAQSEIKAAQKAAAAIEKEEEKKQKYLLKLRMDSIKAANKAEEKAARDAAKSHGGGHAEHGGGGLIHGLAEGTGVAVAIEGFKVLTEKAKEATEANKRLATGTGLTGEALEKQGKVAEQVGDQFSVGGDHAKEVMGKVAFATHATGEELRKQTEAAIAYEAATGRDASRKLLTEKGRAEIMMNASANIAKAQKAANDPAVQAQYIQTKLMETIGELAKTLLGALAPALKVLMPVIVELGSTLGDILKPIIVALTPIITLVGETIKQLAPIITDLISSALEILMPIITSLTDIFSALMPPIMEVVKAIMSALAPVFKALMPIIQEVAGIIKDIFLANAGMLIDMLQNVIVPLIRDLVAPILLSLMPVFKMLADMMRDIVVPAVKVLSGIMSFLMVNVVQPLIKWLSGGLVDAINAVVAVVTAAIKVVNAVVGAFKSLLGMGDDAAVAATKTTVKKVEAVGAEADKQEEYRYNEKEKKAKDHTDKIRKTFIQQQQDLIDLDEQTYAEAIAKLQKYYDTLSEKNIKGRREVSNAIEKYKAAEAETEKKAEDERLKQQELDLANRHLNDEDFAEEKERLQIEHLTRLKEIAEKNGGDVLGAQLALINAQITQQKRIDAERVASVQGANDRITESNNKVAEQSAKDAAIIGEQRKANIASMAKEAEFFSKPFADAFTNTFHKLMKGADDWTAKMAQSNNVLVSIFGGILDGFLKMVEGMIEKIIAFEAILLVANLIPGFSELMGALGGIGSLIPGHAEGTESSPGGWHLVGEKGVELVNMMPGARVIPNHELPLSSGRGGSMGGSYGLDVAPIVAGLSRIETHVAKTKTVLPMNNAFENSRNNYLKSEDRRSI